MNREEHLTIGVIAFFAYTYFIDYFSSDAIGYAFIAAVLGSIVPDILEPPTDWAHRDVFHSVRALKLTGMIFVLTALVGLYTISSFFLGYVCHLLADATTEVGLPD